MRPLLLSLVWVAIVIAYAVLSTIWVNHEPGWYAGLRKPSFQPPDVVFGVMWPLNFLALAIVGVAVGRGASQDTAVLALSLLTTSVAAALGWAYLFYVPHALGPAAIALAVAAALTWALTATLGSHQLWWGLALTPYALWLTVATALAIGYSRLN